MKKLVLSTLALVSLSGMALAADAPEGKGPHGPRGMMFEEMDANKDGAISKQEALDFHGKKFDEMDANHDGKVTKDEGQTYWQAKREEFRKNHPEWAEKHSGKGEPAAGTTDKK
jgi:hypothetical protein